MAKKEQAKQEVLKLIQTFKANINQYKLSTYKETRVNNLCYLAPKQQPSFKKYMIHFIL